MKLLSTIFFFVALSSNSYAEDVKSYVAFYEDTKSGTKIYRLDDVNWKYFGPVSGKMIAFFDGIPAGSYVVVNSLGGSADGALTVSKIIEKKKIRVLVDEVCLSACADYILPVSSLSDLPNTALIGFHNNQLMFRDAKLARGIEDTCSDQMIKDTENLYDRYAIKKNAYKITSDKLEIIDFKKGATCEEDVLYTRNAMWFPTSRQLRDVFGLNITTSVCADDPSCALEKVRKVYKSKSVVIGDQRIDLSKLN